MKTEHPIRFLCGCLDVSPSGYYGWKQRRLSPCRRARLNETLKGDIVQIHRESRQTYGSPRVQASLLQQGKRHGRNRIARLMREQRICGRQKRRYRVRTTDSNHENPIAPNRLAEMPKPSRPDQVWVADITYIDTAEGWLYLAGVLDLYSRRIVGWGMSPRIDTELVLDAWNMALSHRQPAEQVMLHTDRGVQYTSAEFRQSVAGAGATASMNRRANCYDNATMESFWSTLKLEMIHRRKFLTRRQAEHAIFDYIETFYNRRRLHSSLGYKSPEQFEREQNPKNKSIAEQPGGAAGGQGGAQQGTGARGEQYLDGTARSRTIAAKDLFSSKQQISFQS
jgi:transposase InsO family protein